MLCKNCGVEIPEGGGVCPKCGQAAPPQSVGERMKDFYGVLKDGQKEHGIQYVSDMFIDEAEVQLGIVGGGYLSNLVRNGVLGKSFCVLTDKRVYFKGKCFSKLSMGYLKTEEERVVDLKNITSSGFVYIRNYILLGLAVIFLILSICLLLLGIIGGGWDAFALFLVSAVLTAVLAVMYRFSKRVLYQVSYSGNSFTLRASNYGMDELRHFDKELRLAKDRSMEDKHGGSPKAR